jgi:hypothetical protein
LARRSVSSDVMLRMPRQLSTGSGKILAHSHRVAPGNDARRQRAMLPFDEQDDIFPLKRWLLSRFPSSRPGPKQAAHSHFAQWAMEAAP